MAETNRLLASYGRRRGRKLRPTKQGLVDTLLPELTLALPETGSVDPASLFKGKKSYWLEVGFGGGEHLAHQAGLNCDVGIIGCEPYVNGIAGLLKHIDDHKLDNIRIYDHDARVLMDRMPDACLERVFVLYPDPWPKARHNKRRIISTEFIGKLARLMKSGSQLRIATDHADYCTWMLERLLASKEFTWTAKDPEDWLKPWSDWIPTRYEQKGLAGLPTYLTFIRN